MISVKKHSALPFIWCGSLFASFNCKELCYLQLKELHFFPQSGRGSFAPSTAYPFPFMGRGRKKAVNAHPKFHTKSIRNLFFEEQPSSFCKGLLLQKRNAQTSFISAQQKERCYSKGLLSKVLSPPPPDKGEGVSAKEGRNKGGLFPFLLKAGEESQHKTILTESFASITPVKQYTGKFFNQCFDKGRLKNFVLWFLLNYGEHKTISLVEQLKNVGFEYASRAGISLGIDDLKIPPKKSNLIYDAENQTNFTINQYIRGEITGVERFQRLIDTWHRTSEVLKQEVIDYFEATDILNPVYMMAFSGARGNISQVRQLVGMRGLMADPQGQIIDFPIRSNFREGLTLTEYIISSYGARKGIVDTALRTANAGYLTRRLVDVAQHIIISNFDCGTNRGIFLTNMKEGNKTIHSLSQRIVGRILARDLFIGLSTVNPSSKNCYFPKGGSMAAPNHQGGGHRTPGHRGGDKEGSFIASRNEEVTLDLAFEIGKKFDKVFVRSPLTCEKLICQLCYGWSLAQGSMVSIGEAVGVVAAQSIGEPGTQLTMRTFHTGGVFSGDVSDQIKAPFDGVIQYISAIPGTLIRTPEGKIAFLTKSEGSFLVKKISSTTYPKVVSSGGSAPGYLSNDGGSMAAPSFLTEARGSMAAPGHRGGGHRTPGHLSNNGGSIAAPSMAGGSMAAPGHLSNDGGSMAAPGHRGGGHRTPGHRGGEVEIKKFTIPHYTLLYIRNGQNVYEKEVIAQISSISQKTNATDDAELTIKSEIEGQFYSKFLGFREKIVGCSLRSASSVIDASPFPEGKGPFPPFPKGKQKFQKLLKGKGENLPFPLDSQGQPSSLSLLYKRKEQFRNLEWLESDLKGSNALSSFGGKRELPFAQNTGKQEKIYEAWAWGYAWILSGKIYDYKNSCSFQAATPSLPIIGDLLNTKSHMSQTKWSLSNSNGSSISFYYSKRTPSMLSINEQNAKQNKINTAGALKSFPSLSFRKEVPPFLKQNRTLTTSPPIRYRATSFPHRKIDGQGQSSSPISAERWVEEKSYVHCYKNRKVKGTSLQTKDRSTKQPVKTIPSQTTQILFIDLNNILFKKYGYALEVSQKTQFMGKSFASASDSSYSQNFFPLKGKECTYFPGKKQTRGKEENPLRELSNPLELGKQNYKQLLPNNNDFLFFTASPYIYMLPYRSGGTGITPFYKKEFLAKLALPQRGEEKKSLPFSSKNTEAPSMAGGGHRAPKNALSHFSACAQNKNSYTAKKNQIEKLPYIVQWFPNKYKTESGGFIIFENGTFSKKSPFFEISSLREGKNFDNQLQFKPSSISLPEKLGLCPSSKKALKKEVAYAVLENYKAPSLKLKAEGGHLSNDAPSMAGGSMATPSMAGGGHLSNDAPGHRRGGHLSNDAPYPHSILTTTTPNKRNIERTYTINRNLLLKTREINNSKILLVPSDVFKISTVNIMPHLLPAELKGMMTLISPPHHFSPSYRYRAGGSMATPSHLSNDGNGHLSNDAPSMALQYMGGHLSNDAPFPLGGKEEKGKEEGEELNNPGLIQTTYENAFREKESSLQKTNINESIKNKVYYKNSIISNNSQPFPHRPLKGKAEKRRGCGEVVKSFMSIFLNKKINFLQKNRQGCLNISSFDFLLPTLNTGSDKIINKNKVDNNSFKSSILLKIKKSIINEFATVSLFDKTGKPSQREQSSLSPFRGKERNSFTYVQGTKPSLIDTKLETAIEPPDIKDTTKFLFFTASHRNIWLPYSAPLMAGGSIRYRATPGHLSNNGGSMAAPSFLTEARGGHRTPGHRGGDRLSNDAPSIARGGHLFNDAPFPPLKGKSGGGGKKERGQWSNKTIKIKNFTSFCKTIISFVDSNKKSKLNQFSLLFPTFKKTQNKRVLLFLNSISIFLPLEEMLLLQKNEIKKTIPLVIGSNYLERFYKKFKTIKNKFKFYSFVLMQPYIYFHRAFTAPSIEKPSFSFSSPPLFPFSAKRWRGKEEKRGGVGGVQDLYISIQSGKNDNLKPPSQLENNIKFKPAPRHLSNDGGSFKFKAAPSFLTEAGGGHRTPGHLSNDKEIVFHATAKKGWVFVTETPFLNIESKLSHKNISMHSLPRRGRDLYETVNGKFSKYSSSAKQLKECVPILKEKKKAKKSSFLTIHKKLIYAGQPVFPEGEITFNTSVFSECFLLKNIFNIKNISSFSTLAHKIVFFSSFTKEKEIAHSSPFLTYTSVKGYRGINNGEVTHVLGKEGSFRIPQFSTLYKREGNFVENENKDYNNNNSLPHAVKWITNKKSRYAINNLDINSSTISAQQKKAGNSHLSNDALSTFTLAFESSDISIKNEKNLGVTAYLFQPIKEFEQMSNFEIKKYTYESTINAFNNSYKKNMLGFFTENKKPSQNTIRGNFPFPKRLGAISKTKILLLRRQSNPSIFYVEKERKGGFFKELLLVRSKLREKISNALVQETRLETNNLQKARNFLFLTSFSNSQLLFIKRKEPFVLFNAQDLSLKGRGSLQKRKEKVLLFLNKYIHSIRSVRSVRNMCTSLNPLRRSLKEAQLLPYIGLGSHRFSIVKERKVLVNQSFDSLLKLQQFKTKNLVAASSPPPSPPFCGKGEGVKEKDSLLAKTDVLTLSFLHLKSEELEQLLFLHETLFFFRMGQSNKEIQKATKIIDQPARNKMNFNLINSLLLFIICSIKKTDIITLQTKLDKSDKSGKVVAQELEGSDEPFSHFHLQRRKDYQKGAHQVPVNSFREREAQGEEEDKKEGAISFPSFDHMREGKFYVPFYYIKDLKALLRASSVKQFVYDYLSSATCSLPEGLVSSPVGPLSPTASSLKKGKKGGSQKDQSPSLAQRAREVASISQLGLENSLRLHKEKQQGLRSRKMLLKKEPTLPSPSHECIPVKGLKGRGAYQHKKESFFQRAVLLEQSYPQEDFLITSNILTETVFPFTAPFLNREGGHQVSSLIKRGGKKVVLAASTQPICLVSRKQFNVSPFLINYKNLPCLPSFSRISFTNETKSNCLDKGVSLTALTQSDGSNYFFPGSLSSNGYPPSPPPKGEREGGGERSFLPRAGNKKQNLNFSYLPISNFDCYLYPLLSLNLSSILNFYSTNIIKNKREKRITRARVETTNIYNSYPSMGYFSNLIPENISATPPPSLDRWLGVRWPPPSLDRWPGAAIEPPSLDRWPGAAIEPLASVRKEGAAINLNEPPSLDRWPEAAIYLTMPLPALVPEEKLHKQKTNKFFSYAIFNSLINNVFESPCFSFNLVKLMDLSTFKKTKTQKTQFLYNNDLNQKFSPSPLMARGSMATPSMAGGGHRAPGHQGGKGLFNTNKKRVKQQQEKSSNSLFKNKTNQIQQIQAKTNYYSPFKGEIVYAQTIAPKDKLLLNDRVTANASTLTFFSTQQKETFSAQHPSPLGGEGSLYKRDSLITGGSMAAPSFLTEARGSMAAISREPSLGGKRGKGNLSDTKIDSFSYSCMFLTKKDLISYYFPYSHQKQESTKITTYTAPLSPLGEKREGSGVSYESGVPYESSISYGGGENGKNLPHSLLSLLSPFHCSEAVSRTGAMNYEINDTLIKFSLLTPLYNEGEKTEFISKLSTSGPLDKSKGIALSSPFPVEQWGGEGEQTVIQISKTQAGKPMITGSPFRISNNKSFSLLGDFYAYGDPISQLTSRFLHFSEEKENMHTILSPEKLADGAERKVTLQRAIQVSGQVIHYNKAKITVRRAQPIFISPKGILHKFDGDFIDPKSPVITLSYQRLKTGDIIQGIPKVEQFFEARTTKRGRLFRDSLPSLLKALFKRYESKIPLELAVRQSFYKIQQIIVDGVQRVYKSQGVTISDKHLEVIVKQMTSKVRVIDGAQTGFFPGEVVDLTFIEKINQFLIKKITYEPLVLGITKASLEVDSFLSASSFQQTTRVLSQAAIYRKKDFLKGLKENVILGNLIPAGTGYLVQLDNF